MEELEDEGGRGGRRMGSTMMKRRVLAESWAESAPLIRVAHTHLIHLVHIARITHSPSMSWVVVTARVVVVIVAVTVTPGGRHV